MYTSCTLHPSSDMQPAPPSYMYIHVHCTLHVHPSSDMQPAPPPTLYLSFVPYLLPTHSPSLAELPNRGITPIGLVSYIEWTCTHITHAYMYRRMNFRKPNRLVNYVHVYARAHVDKVLVDGRLNLIMRTFWSISSRKVVREHAIAK